MKCNWSFFRGGAVLLVLLMALASCKSRKMLTDSSKDRGKQLKGSLKERYASLLDVSQREIKNERLYRFIDDWMGVRYRNGGMDKKGVDCSGFVVLLEREIYGKSVPRIAKSMADNVKRKYEEELEEGDLVFFDFSGQKFSHVGVYLKNNRFVHASSSKGVIISNLKDGWYYKYFSRCGSVKANYYSVVPVDSLQTISFSAEGAKQEGFVFNGIMNKENGDYSFWTKYRRFASTEIMLYVIMIAGILLGILIFS